MSQSKDALEVMQGYIDHLAFNFVKPIVEEEVINKNGGLVVTRSVESWLTGREEPILKLSLEPDDPRILFSFMGTDLTLAPEGGTMGGKGFCRMSNDVENTVTACYPTLRKMPCLEGLTFSKIGAKQAARGNYLAVEPYTGIYASTAIDHMTIPRLPLSPSSLLSSPPSSSMAEENEEEEDEDEGEDEGGREGGHPFPSVSQTCPRRFLSDVK
eukprot:evm.model.NODE_13100_length_6470_cov_25.108656.1